MAIRDLRNTSRQPLCSEPLEGRCLLSGVAPASSAAAAEPVAPQSVYVVELEYEDDEPDGDDREVAIDLSDLPRRVLAAFNAVMPDGVALGAAFGIDDGRPEYEVKAAFKGSQFDLTFSPTGRLIEAEQMLADVALPSPVLDWVRERFGDDTPIDEASAVFEDGELGFEFTVADADGRLIEATLRVPGAEAPDLPRGFDGISAADDESDEDGNAGDPEVEPAVAIAGVDAMGPDARDANAVSDAQPDVDAIAVTPQNVEVAADPTATSAETSAPAHAAAHAGSAAVAAESTGGAADRDAPNLAVPDRLAMAAVPVEWLPYLAGTLDDVLPTLDTAAVERRLDDILQRVDALAGSVIDGVERAAAAANVDPAGAAKAAAVVALVVASRFVPIRSRRGTPGAAPAVFGAGNGAGSSSWTWVLGAPSTASRAPAVSDADTNLRIP